MKIISVLNEFYKSRENEISTLTEVDKKKLESLFWERKQKNEELEIAISNIPEALTETINNLKNKIQEKLEVEHNIDNYYTERAYKSGFSDAIKLIMECKDIWE